MSSALRRRGADDDGVMITFRGPLGTDGTRAQSI